MNQKHEIILVTSGLTNGGAERVLTGLMEIWERNGYKIIIFQLERDMYDEQYYVPDTIPVIQAGKPIPFFFPIQYAIRLLKLIRSHPNAVVLALLNYEILIVSLCNPLISNKIIFSERCDPTHLPGTPFRRKVRDFLYYAADACIFQTPDAKKHFPARVQARGVVIPNPINPHVPVRYEGVKRNVIVAACRLSKQKNIPMIIDAFALFVKEHPQYTLEIYGRGGEEEFLSNRIGELGLTGKVLLKGFAENIYDIMKRCCMYVSSSDYEGMSNSMMEAMALGLPVVVTDCPAGGARMVVQDGENGLLVPVGDTEAMYLAMKRVIEEPGLAERLGNEAYKVRERFTIEKIAKEWLDVIEA